MQSRTEPFGEFALTGWRAALHAFASAMPRHWAGKQMRSAVRRLALAGRPLPVDVAVLGGARMRLYPDENLTDKHLFANPNHWDEAERKAVTEALAGCPRELPVSFIDLGANVGAYALMAVFAARAMGRAIRVLAIEPGSEARRRMSFNVTASGCGDAITVMGAAIGPAGSSWEIIAKARNLGELQLVPASEPENQVPVSPLADVLMHSGFTRPDIIKIDIEGLESIVLHDYFNAVAPEALPRLIIAETRGGRSLEIATLCAAAGYERLFDNGRNGAFLRMPASQTAR
ncbi:MAG: FkbM family methyltransferase [Rhodobiaceae bacterium]|nr:FkbM family methyltransferase [Rhodobiaceae bacterium]MCC0055410.1 FkbM family methyltransferase [Rhodobiaceae bacterium]